MIEEEAPAVQAVQAQQIEQMRIFWQYIQGMVRFFLYSIQAFRELADL